MTVRTDDITAADWSPQIGNPGEIVVDLADIDQCIAIILTTRKGSDPHRPLFGCDAWMWLDRPLQVSRPNIIREAIDSLTIWEPRLEIVSVTLASSQGQLTISAMWQPKGTANLRTTEVSLDAIPS